VTQIRPSHHLDRPSNRRDLVEPDRKAQGFALEPVEALPMLIEVWLCQKTDGARRPSAVGLTQVLRRRAALRGSLGVRLLRKLLTNPLVQPRSTANAVTNRRPWAAHQPGRRVDYLVISVAVSRSTGHPRLCRVPQSGSSAMWMPVAASGRCMDVVPARNAQAWVRLRPRSGDSPVRRRDPELEVGVKRRNQGADAPHGSSRLPSTRPSGCARWSRRGCGGSCW
jgi:hypothetical protein